MNTSPRLDRSVPNAGSMTTAMRALAAPVGPRIPRIAVVRAGRITDEHLVRDDGAVTIGSGEEARILVRDARMPASFTLIERVGDRHWLRFTDAMTGRVSGPNGLVQLEELRARGHDAGGAYRVLLDDDARGKIVLGDTTFLFQLVPRPPVIPRPQLPLGVTRGIGLDWSLTIIAAFSFLLHFGVAGAIYSDWLDPVIDVDRTVAGLVDDLQRLPKAEPERILPFVVDGAPAPVTPAPAAPNARSSPASAPGQRSTATRGGMNDASAAALVARAEQMELDLLASRSNGPAVQNALTRGAVPIVDLSSAAAKNVGVSRDADTGLKVAHGGPVEQGKTNLSTLGGPTRRTGQDSAGPENGPAGPTIRVDAPVLPVSGAVSDADRVVASLRARFRRCYQDGLAVTPTMTGKAVIVAKIAPNGEVSSTEIASNEGLSSSVTACLAKVVQGAQFTGNGSTATVRIPVSLVKQQ